MTCGAVRLLGARPFLNVMLAAVTVMVAFWVAPTVFRRMKLPVNPPLNGTLPLILISRLFFQSVTARQNPGPELLTEFQVVAVPPLAVTSYGWLGTSTVKQ